MYGVVQFNGTPNQRNFSFKTHKQAAATCEYSVSPSDDTTCMASCAKGDNFRPCLSKYSIVELVKSRNKAKATRQENKRRKTTSTCSSARVASSFDHACHPIPSAFTGNPFLSLMMASFMLCDRSDRAGSDGVSLNGLYRIKQIEYLLVIVRQPLHVVMHTSQAGLLHGQFTVLNQQCMTKRTSRFGVLDTRDASQQGQGANEEHSGQIRVCAPMGNNFGHKLLSNESNMDPDLDSVPFSFQRKLLVVIQRTVRHNGELSGSE